MAVGKHLGYLFTGLWSAPAGVALIQSDLLHPLFGIAGLLLARCSCSAPWSRLVLWLLALGVGLLVTA